MNDIYVHLWDSMQFSVLDICFQNFIQVPGCSKRGISIPMSKSFKWKYATLPSSSTHGFISHQTQRRPQKVSKSLENLTLPETNSSHPENWRLEDDPASFWGFSPIFRCFNVSFREGSHFSMAIRIDHHLNYEKMLYLDLPSVLNLCLFIKQRKLPKGIQVFVHFFQPQIKAALSNFFQPSKSLFNMFCMLFTEFWWILNGWIFRLAQKVQWLFSQLAIQKS